MLILGWKNGILVGATGGITIGVVLGIIGGSEPVMIAVYAVSGMIAGLLNRFGRIGVVVGFILGNVVIAYAANGNSVPLIMFQEILIASLGLLAIPKEFKLILKIYLVLQNYYQKLLEEVWKKIKIQYIN